MSVVDLHDQFQIFCGLFGGAIHVLSGDPEASAHTDFMCARETYSTFFSQTQIKREFANEPFELLVFRNSLLYLRTEMTSSPVSDRSQ